jgi:multimeric flavodoxin WrbA
LLTAKERGPGGELFSFPLNFIKQNCLTTVMFWINLPSDMKNILGIMGSPRKNGNTHVLVSKILEGAQEAGAHTETVLLGDVHIKECDGCHACWKGFECNKKDDMNKLYSKIIKSDVIIFGTPVYWYGSTALMKAFIDRMVYFNCPENRKKIKGKKAVLVVPFEEQNPATARLVKEFFKKSLGYLDVKLIETLLVPGVTKRGEVKKKEDVMERAFLLGAKISQ